jgi:uncharacterized membrane protein (UPF0127 family)
MTPHKLLRIFLLTALTGRLPPARPGGYSPETCSVLQQDVTFRVNNATRDISIGYSIETAETSAQRRTGLLRRSGLKDGTGLWIVPCEGVHTLFMKFPIDLIYIDRKRRVRSVVHGLSPWRFSMCLRAHSVLELPPGTINRTGTQKGDQLEMEPMTAPATPSAGT